MKINDLNLSEAPQCGHYLVYTGQDVFFGHYSDLSKVAQKLNDTDLLEIHLFDDLKEYRAIVSESRRFPDGRIEYTADFPEEDEEHIFKEEILLEKEQKKLLVEEEENKTSGEKKQIITVLNYICYNPENGQAVIDDYRLK